MSDLLTATEDQVAAMSRGERALRVRLLVDQAHSIVDQVIQEEVTGAGKKLAATAVLYSGGNDSTTLAHLFRHRVDHAIHINTGIGIEATREFVRKTCADWGVPLIEEHPPPGVTYRETVIKFGFPGPAQHNLMYRRLKERGLRQARRQLIGNRGRSERVVFLTGVRRHESERRSGIPDRTRDGAVVFAAPLRNWTKLDLNTYRQLFPEVPRNPVADALHMSGECLCGAFAHKGELDEIGFWYPEVAEEIRALEREVAAAGHEGLRCQWGWGRYEDRKRIRKAGLLCTACDVKAGAA